MSHVSWRSNGKKGVPVAVNGRRESPVTMIEQLNELAGRHGIGRVDLVENRLVGGMKSRGVYETPAGTLLTYAIGSSSISASTVIRCISRSKWP